MVAYNFQARFAPMVEDGRKRQTIRALRKDGRHAKVGDALQLYTGMRTKACRKLVDPDPTCVSASPVVIDENGIAGPNLVGIAPDQFALDDGFSCFDEMRAWLRETHGLPFHGVLIDW